MPALHALLGSQDHVVAQVVKAELRVRAVRDIQVVRLTLGGQALAALQVTSLHAEEAVDGAHPLAVALGEVVVDGDDVDALAGNGVQVAGERGDERLALTGFHFGDATLVQGHAADKLHVEVAHAQYALGCLTHHGKRLGQQVIEGLAICIAGAEQFGLMRELRVVHGLVAGLEGVNVLDDLAIAVQILVGTERKQLGNKSHVSSLSCTRNSRWPCATNQPHTTQLLETLVKERRRGAQDICTHGETT